jgi:hypothetical protein
MAYPASPATAGRKKKRQDHGAYGQCPWHRNLHENVFLMDYRQLTQKCSLVFSACPPKSIQSSKSVPEHFFRLPDERDQVQPEV